MDDSIYSVAIDGPAGAGKSTIAKKVSNILGIEYIDTGAMFRAATLKMLENDIDLKDEEEIQSILKNTDIDFLNGTIYLDGKDVSKQIRENEISKNASNFAKLGSVREKMLVLQREIAKNKSVLMDGRDIGSIVLPKADYKFYLTASLDERARRRYRELEKKGIDIDYETVKKEIKARDKSDSTRKIAPLIQAEDAILIDSTELDIEETISHILSFIDR